MNYGIAVVARFSHCLAFEQVRSRHWVSLAAKNLEKADAVRMIEPTPPLWVWRQDQSQRSPVTLAERGIAPNAATTN